MPSGVSATRSIFGISSKTRFVFIVSLIVAGVTLMVRTDGRDFLGNLFPAPGPAAELPRTPILAPSSETAIVVPTLKVTPLSTETSTPALIFVDVSTSEPGDTVTPLPYAHGFEVTKMPPGSDQGYLVHIVAVGETLDKIADHYSTTVEAIMAVNYELKPPVWVQYPIVIPVGTKDATGLPAFKVYVVEAYESISAEALAEVLGVDASAFEYYNLCTDNCQFNKGDVLLVPYDVE